MDTLLIKRCICCDKASERFICKSCKLGLEVCDVLCETANKPNLFKILLETFSEKIEKLSEQKEK